MRRILTIVLLLLVFRSEVNAAEFNVGDLVFWKDGTQASDGTQEISIATFSFPSTVRDVQNDFLFLGGGWIHKDDALSVDEALEYFSTQIQENPQEAAYFNNRGRVWAAKNEFDEAIADFSEAAKLDPKDAITRNNLGTAWQSKGDHEQAVKHFGAAIDINPKHATAYYNRGRAHQFSGDYASAVKDYLDAIRADPKYLPAYNNAAWLAATCPDDEYRDGKLALAYANQAVQMTQGKVWEVLDTLAATQAENGDFAAAVKTSEQALKLGSDAALHGGVRDRMDLYQSGKPYRMPAD